MIIQSTFKACGPGAVLKCHHCGKYYDWWCGDQAEGQRQFLAQKAKLDQIDADRIHHLAHMPMTD